MARHSAKPYGADAAASVSSHGPACDSRSEHSARWLEIHLDPLVNDLDRSDLVPVPVESRSTSPRVMVVSREMARCAAATVRVATLGWLVGRRHCHQRESLS
jgi:hypothetical protein